VSASEENSIGPKISFISRALSFSLFSIKNKAEGSGAQVIRRRL